MFSYVITIFKDNYSIYLLVLLQSDRRYFGELWSYHETQFSEESGLLIAGIKGGARNLQCDVNQVGVRIERVHARQVWTVIHRFTIKQPISLRQSARYSQLSRCTAISNSLLTIIKSIKNQLELSMNNYVAGGYMYYKFRC